MAVTARLSNSLHRLLGDEPAEELVDWMHRVDSNRSELRELNDLSYARLDSKIDGLRHELRADMAELRHGVSAEIAELREEVRVGRADVVGIVEKRFAGLLRWSFAFWATMLLALFASRNS